MSDDPDQEPSEDGPKQVGGELIIPVAAILFTIYYFSTIINVPWTAQVSAFFVGSILIVLCAGFIIRTAVQRARGEISLSIGKLIAPVAYIPKRLALLALTVGYIIVIPWTGFTLTTFLFLAASMLVLSEGKKKRTILILSAILSLGGYLLFIVAFKTRFPVGPFESMMKGLF